MTDEPIWTVRLYKGDIGVARAFVAIPNGAQPSDVAALNVQTTFTVRDRISWPADDTEPFFGVDRGAAHPTQRGFYGIDRSTLVTHRFMPWEDLPAIAALVRGDGTDPQRQALADGILEGAHTEKPSWW